MKLQKTKSVKLSESHVKMVKFSNYCKWLQQDEKLNIIQNKISTFNIFSLLKPYRNAEIFILLNYRYFNNNFSDLFRIP